MEVKLQMAYDLAKGNERRIEKLEEHQEQQDKLLNTVALIAQKQEDMGKSISELKEDTNRGMKELKSDFQLIKDKPGKRWDAIVDKAILAVITGLIAYIMYRLGLV